MKNDLLKVGYRYWRFSLVLMTMLLFMAQATYVTAAESAVVADRAKELAANTPKTPEDFLRLVREWMDDPYMDAYAFAEKITGVERENFISTGHGLSRTISSYNIIGNMNYGPVSIHITSKNHIWDIIIPIHQYSLCINEEIVQKILGDPSKISNKMPSKYRENAVDYTPMIYNVYNGNSYKTTITFGFEESKFGNILDLPTTKQKEIYAYINNPDNNKYICSTRVRFGTYED